MRGRLTASLSNGPPFNEKGAQIFKWPILQSSNIVCNNRQWLSSSSLFGKVSLAFSHQWYNRTTVSSRVKVTTDVCGCTDVISYLWACAISIEINGRRNWFASLGFISHWGRQQQNAAPFTIPSIMVAKGFWSVTHTVYLKGAKSRISTRRRRTNQISFTFTVFFLSSGRAQDSKVKLNLINFTACT